MALAKGPREKVIGKKKDFEANRRQKSSLFCDVLAIHTAQTEGFPDLMHEFFHVAPIDFQEGRAADSQACPDSEFWLHTNVYNVHENSR